MLKTTGSSAVSASEADSNEAVSGGADGGIGGNRIAAPLTAMLKTGSSAASASGVDGDEVTGGGADGSVGRSGRSNASQRKLAKSKKLQISKVQNIGCTEEPSFRGPTSEILQTEHSNHPPATALDDYFRSFKPDFPLCSRALNRPTGPGKNSLDTSLTSILLTANGAVDALSCFRRRIPWSWIQKSSTGGLSFVGYCQPFEPQPCLHQSIQNSRGSLSMSLSESIILKSRLELSMLRLAFFQEDPNPQPATEYCQFLGLSHADISPTLIARTWRLAPSFCTKSSSADCALLCRC
ncbi:hypothetical protein MMC31_000760 [Peltigera leucophlebia]|nr:hypothetical protein [Peltigera leucophlebia]